MQDGLATLETQLQEKDELVQVLTARLEQAAEQLDRLHRTGTTPGPRQSEASSTELADQQSLVEDLRTAVDQWIESQPGEALVRIENQLEELRALVMQGASPSAHGVRAIDDTDDDADETCNNNSSGWEDLKAELLAQDGEPGTENPLENVGAVDDVFDGEFDDSDVPTTECVTSDSVEAPADDCPEPDPPVPVDFDAATENDLRRAVENRDEYISFLIKKLRLIESRGELAAPDWSQLQDAPEELRQRLEELEGRLEEMLRISEVEISLERARLSREETRLKQVQHEVEKQVARIGKSGKSGTADNSTGTPEGKGRRWLKFLSASGDEADGD